MFAVGGDFHEEQNSLRDYYDFVYTLCVFGRGVIGVPNRGQKLYQRSTKVYRENR